MKSATRAILGELRQGLESLYGRRLKGVYLFGSYARDRADAESDMDILIVLDRIGDYSSEIEATSQIIAALSLKYGVTLSRVLTSEDRWKHDATLFFQNVREEAVLV